MLTQVAPTLYASSGRIGTITNGTVSGVLAFDLDWTLIKPTRGRFSNAVDDWTFLPNRIAVLSNYSQQGYTLAIFSNQHYSGVKLQTALNRVNNVIAQLNANGIYPFVYVATGEDMYRKPGTGMWSYFLSVLGTYGVTSVPALYTGDAAGRSGDFSDSDKAFASNAGIGFSIPQHVFHSNL